MRVKLLFVLFLLNAGALRAANILWTNVAGGSWQAAVNWQPNQVPGAADTALIMAEGNYTITLTTNVTVAGMTLGGASGTQTVLLTGQTLRATNSATVETHGLLAVESGGLAGNVAVAAGGTIVLSGSAQKVLQQLTLVNSGTVRWQGGGLSLGSTPGTIITNAGLWEISSDANIFRGANGPEIRFVNSGAVKKLGGTGTTVFNAMHVNNSGAFEALSGTMQFNGMADSLLGGTFTAAAGATNQLVAGTYFENGGVFSGAGASRMTGGTLTLIRDKMGALDLAGGEVRLGQGFQNNGAITDLTINGATLSVTNEVAGTLTMAAGALSQSLAVRPGATLVFASAAQKTFTQLTLVNNGTVRWQGGNLALGATFASVVTNAGLWEISSDNSYLQGTGGSGSRFVNLGTVRKISGTGLTTFSNMQFHNVGLLEVQNGTVQFSLATGAILGGTFSAAAGATFQLVTGTYVGAGGVFNGAGALRMSGGVLTLDADKLPGLSLAGGDVKLGAAFQAGGAITDLTLNGANLAGTNEVAGVLSVLAGGVVDKLTVRTNGILTFPGATLKRLTQLTLINNGTVRWLGGNLTLGGTQSTVITNFGLWEIGADGTISQTVVGPEARFVNLGTVRKFSGSGAATFSTMHFNNAGLVDVESGTIQFSAMAGAILGGSFKAETGGVLQLTGGTYTGNGAVFTGGGMLRMTLGILSLDTDQLVGLSLNGGEVRLGANFQAGGAITSLTLNGAFLGGTNEVAGTLTVLAGALTQKLTVRPGGLLNFPGSGAKTLQQLTLINNGTVRWVGGNLSLGVNPPTTILNAGLWEIIGDNSIAPGTGGPLSTFMNAGTIRKTVGTGTTTFSNLHFENEGMVDLQSGTLQFAGGSELMMGGTFNTALGARFLLAAGTFLDDGAAITGAGTFRVIGGVLTLPSNLPANLAVAGGELMLGEDFQGGSITNLTIDGATLSGTNEVTGSLTVLSGAINDQLTVRAGAILNLSGAGAKSLYPLKLINNGTVRWSGGAVALGASGLTVINNTGLWECLGNDSMAPAFAGGLPQFSNSGLFRKSVGTGVTTLSTLDFQNTGVVEAQTGTLRFPTNYTHTAGTLRLAGGRIEAPGIFTVASGTLEGSGSFGENNFTGGRISPGLNGPGRIAFSGLKLGPGATVAIDVLNPALAIGFDQLTITGAVDLGGAALQIDSLPQLSVGLRLTIIDNDGADAALGSFAGRAEGNLFNVAGQALHVSYVAGSGNDVALVREEEPMHLTSGVPLADGTFRITGLGVNARNYLVLTTTNFTTWTEVGSATANNAGIFQVIDLQTANQPRRFYRSLQVGP